MDALATAKAVAYAMGRHGMHWFDVGSCARCCSRGLPLPCGRCWRLESCAGLGGVARRRRLALGRRRQIGRLATAHRAPLPFASGIRPGASGCIGWVAMCWAFVTTGRNGISPCAWRRVEFTHTRSIEIIECRTHRRLRLGGAVQQPRRRDLCDLCRLADHRQARLAGGGLVGETCGEGVNEHKEVLGAARRCPADVAHCAEFGGGMRLFTPQDLGDGLFSDALTALAGGVCAEAKARHANNAARVS